MFESARTPEQEERGRLLANRGWLNENLAAVQDAYGDRWVAVLDQAVVAGDLDVEVVKAAAGARRGEALIIRIPVGPVPRPI